MDVRDMDVLELLDEAGRVSPAANATIEAAVDLVLGAAAEETSRPVSVARAPGRRRRLVLGATAVVVAAAVAVVAVVLPTGGGGTRPAQPSTAAPHHSRPQTLHYRVAGYTSAQAAAATEQCLAAAGVSGPDGAAGKDAALRATFSDTLGSLLVVTTPTGFYTCNETLAGTVSPFNLFETYALYQGDVPPPNAPSFTPPPGSPKVTPAQPDLAAHWLEVPVELDTSGGGVIGKPNPTGWVSYAIGRVAPNVTKVTVQLMGGDTVTATVENGFFVAREAMPSMPAIAQGAGTTPVMGYDSSGALVYDSLTTSWAIPPGTTGPIPLPTSFPCFVTPSGQPVSPVPAGQTCQTAVPWGY